MATKSTFTIVRIDLIIISYMDNKRNINCI